MKKQTRILMIAAVMLIVIAVRLFYPEILTQLNGGLPSVMVEELDGIEYTGDLVVEVNGNEPFFTEEELAIDVVFESYEELDMLDRAGTAFALADETLLPTEERESISHVYPTGWEQNEYDFVDGGYLYNRSHLIAFSIAGEQDNELNLITGTRSMNQVGMLQYEMEVLDYIKETGEPVLYRVTPIYSGTNLLASGVLMEAYSTTDGGENVNFCIFVFNAEDGVEIDYATGENVA